MALRSSGISGFHPFVEQLQALSEVTESLTYRLLELEERLAAQECELRTLADEAAGEEDLEACLQDAQQRLAHIEELLAGGEPRVRGRILEAVGSPGRRPMARFTRSGAEGRGREDVLPADTEQDGDGEEYIDTEERFA